MFPSALNTLALYLNSLAELGSEQSFARSLQTSASPMHNLYDAQSSPSSFRGKRFQPPLSKKLQSIYSTVTNRFPSLSRYGNFFILNGFCPNLARMRRATRQGVHSLFLTVLPFCQQRRRLNHLHWCFLFSVMAISRLASSQHQAEL